MDAMQQKALPAPAAVMAAYACGVLVWYPWILSDYAGLSLTKMSTLVVFTLLCGLALNFLLPENARRIPLGAPGRWMLAWAGAAALSTLVSLSPPNSLLGQESYLGGLALCILCLLGYLGLACWPCPDAGAALVPWFLVSGAGVCALGAAQDLGLDPFGLSAPLGPGERGIFFSTIGNVDYLNSYFCLWLPLAAWTFLRGATPRRRALGLGCAAVGCVGLACLDPGIASIGLLFALLVLLWAVPLAGRDTARLLVLAAVWLAAQWAVQAVQTQRPLLLQERPLQIFGAPWLALPLAVLLLLAAGWLWRRRGAPALRAQRGLVCGAVLMLAGLFAWCSSGSGSLGGLDNFFCIGPAWATGRGALWADGIWLYGRGGLLRWLAGYGPGMVHRALLLAGSAAPYFRPDTVGVHNEYLETLVCGGALGLLTWLGVLAVHLGPALRRAQADPVRAGWALALCAYAGQAFFNNRVCAVFPLATVLLALTRAPEPPVPASPGTGMARTAAAAAAGMLAAMGTALLLQGLGVMGALTFS